MDMTVTSAEKGNTAVNWYDEYDSKPSPGMIGRPVQGKGIGLRTCRTNPTPD